MHDKTGKAIHIGDRVQTPAGAKFHVNGGVLDDGTVVGGNMAHAKHVAFAHDVEIIEKHAQNEGREGLGGGSIVWGNGPPDPTP